LRLKREMRLVTLLFTIKDASYPGSADRLLPLESKIPFLNENA
jgi:hypothetical protein